MRQFHRYNGCAFYQRIAGDAASLRQHFSQDLSAERYARDQIDRSAEGFIDVREKPLCVLLNAGEVCITAGMSVEDRDDDAIPILQQFSCLPIIPP